MASKDLARQLMSAAPIEPIDPKRAHTAWALWREMNGYASYQPLLTPPKANVKLAKSGELDYGVSLAPDRSSGLQVCSFSTHDCRRGCIAYGGHGRFKSNQEARTSKTRFLAADPAAFVTLVATELDQVGATACRLNVFSDLPWEDIAPWLFERPHIRFYDYTKRPGRITPANYHLTYSASEKTSDQQICELTAAGVNVAVVFDTPRQKDLPTSWLGVPVIDGDKTDQRFNDPAGVIVGLRAKGRMRSGNWKMVRKVHS